ncbi:cache domain-containing sensor histidine kinase [Romboutsia sp.]|uniref:cache domain-containing sensor histidine kinase n=1 Tax=Romboutsia sp. TaxID=1965302 RepID=UPI003F3F8E09
MKRFYSLSSRLIMLFTISVLIPMIVSLIFLFNYFTGILSKQNIEAYKNTLNSVSNNIDTYLDDLERLTLSPYMYNEVYKYLSYLNANLNEQNTNDIYLYNLNKNYSSILNKLINTSRKDILAITFVPINDTSKSFLVNKHYYALTEMTSPKDYRSWIKLALQAEGGIYFTPLHNIQYPMSSNTYKVFSLMRVIKNPDTKKVIGVIKVDAEESTLKSIVSSIDISTSSEFLLLDEYKQIIYSTHPRDKYTEVKNEYNFDYHTSVLSNYNVLEKKISSNSWTLLYFGSRVDLYAKTFIILIVFIIIGLLFLSFSILFFKLRIKDIINSIYNITSSMEKLESGQALIDSNISGTHEFELISKAINKIASNIDKYAKNEYEAIIKQKKAEYTALQSQINPHFLNNILSGFITLNRINEKQLLEDSIIQLSQFYRYTCNNSNVSTLEEEFYCIDKYLHLEKLRFDDLIEFELSLDDITKDIKLPKLILQPLVENCVKHGFRESGEPIFIIVKSAIETIDDLHFLIVTVCDNGDGFDLTKTNPNNSVGIKNVRERLQLFESDSEFTIESTPRISTICTIKLLLKEEHNYDYITG